MPESTSFAMSEHISLMFAGSNLLHHNLLTGCVNASLGDKWNCFWGMHFICNFPMKNMTLNGFCVERWLRERQTQGKCSRGLAQDGVVTVAFDVAAHMSGECGSEMFNATQVNNAQNSQAGHFHCFRSACCQWKTMAVRLKSFNWRVLGPKKWQSEFLGPKRIFEKACHGWFFISSTYHKMMASLKHDLIGLSFVPAGLPSEHGCTTRGHGEIDRWKLPVT